MNVVILGKSFPNFYIVYSVSNPNPSKVFSESSQNKVSIKVKTIKVYLIHISVKFQRKLTAACQTNAKRKKSTGMTGIKFTSGVKKE